MEHLTMCLNQSRHPASSVGLCLAALRTHGYLSISVQHFLHKPTKTPSHSKQTWKNCEENPVTCYGGRCGRWANL